MRVRHPTRHSMSHRPPADRPGIECGPRRGVDVGERARRNPLHPGRADDRPARRDPGPADSRSSPVTGCGSGCAGARPAERLAGCRRAVRGVARGGSPARRRERTVDAGRARPGVDSRWSCSGCRRGCRCRAWPWRRWVAARWPATRRQHAYPDPRLAAALRTGPVAVRHDLARGSSSSGTSWPARSSSRTLKRPPPIGTICPDSAGSAGVGGVRLQGRNAHGDRRGTGHLGARPEQMERINDDDHRDRGGEDRADHPRKTGNGPDDLVADPYHRVPQERSSNSLQHASDVAAAPAPAPSPGSPSPTERDPYCRNGRDRPGRMACRAPSCRQRPTSTR